MRSSAAACPADGDELPSADADYVSTATTATVSRRILKAHDVHLGAAVWDPAPWVLPVGPGDADVVVRLLLTASTYDNSYDPNAHDDYYEPTFTELEAHAIPIDPPSQQHRGSSGPRSAPPPMPLRVGVLLPDVFPVAPDDEAAIAVLPGACHRRIHRHKRRQLDHQSLDGGRAGGGGAAAAGHHRRCPGWPSQRLVYRSRTAATGATGRALANSLRRLAQ